MDSQRIEVLKRFVEECRQNPSVLHTPPLAFFKHFLQSLGAQIPAFRISVKVEEEDQDEKKPIISRVAISNRGIVESDVELEVVEPDNDPPQKMGDPSIRVTEENQEAAQLCRAKAMDAITVGKFIEAIDHLTEAIVLNPKSAILYADRASVFVKLKKPNAAIRDANASLQINPDSGKGYKARGMARALLGKWEDASGDLLVASKLEFDEEIDSILKKVEANARKVKEHRLIYERRRKEKEPRKIEPDAPLHPVKSEEAELANMVKDDGKVTVEVIVIKSASELKTKLREASGLSRLAVVYFTASWCGPCVYLGPVVKSFAEKYPNVMFLKIDIDECRDVGAALKIPSIPCFYYYKKGKVVEKVLEIDLGKIEGTISRLSG